MESKQRKRKHDSQDANPDVEFFQKHGYVIIRNVWTTKQTGLFSKHAEETIKHYLQQGNNLPQQSVVNRGRNRIDIQVSNKWPLCKTKRFCFPSKITSILQQLLGICFFHSFLFYVRGYVVTFYSVSFSIKSLLLSLYG